MPAQQPAPSPQLGQKVQANPQQALTSLQIADGTAAITDLEQKRNSKIICLTYNEAANSGLGFPVIPILEAVLSDIGPVPRLDLFIRSTGGQAGMPDRS
jgi:hypothetical protein